MALKGFADELIDIGAANRGFARGVPPLLHEVEESSGRSHVQYWDQERFSSIYAGQFERTKE
jgi:hypothetical protein